MVGREGDPNIVQSHRIVNKPKKISEIAVCSQRHVRHLGAVRAKCVTDKVIFT